MTKSSNYLFVEGKNDKHVVLSLLSCCGVEENFEIRDCGSDEQALKELGVRLKGSAPQVLGLILDTDSDFNSRWQGLRSFLIRNGYQNAPEKPRKRGTIISINEKVTIGVWLMPNNNAEGMLEDFLISLIPSEHPLFKYVRKCVGEIPDNLRLFRPVHKSKAEVHTWLAWQENPGKPLGLGIQCRYFNTALEPAHEFIQWINELFSASSTADSPS